MRVCGALHHVGSHQGARCREIGLALTIRPPCVPGIRDTSEMDPERHSSASPRGESPRDDVMRAAVEALEQLEQRAGHASEAIARSFRHHRELTAAGRARAARSIYAVLRSERLLDFALSRVGAALANEGSRPLMLWIARGILDGEVRFSTARELLPEIDWRALPAAAQSADSISDPIERLATIESLPDWLAARLVDQVGLDEAIALSAALNRPAPVTIRANRILTDREALAHRLRERGCSVRETSDAADGLILEGEVDLFRLPEFRDGWFEVQDEGSQLVSELVAPPPGGRILDACAGAGGKTLHLGALLRGKGRIASVGVGPSASRQLVELRRRADRAKLHNVQVFWVDEELPPEAMSSDDLGAEGSEGTDIDPAETLALESESYELLPRGSLQNERRPRSEGDSTDVGSDAARMARPSHTPAAGHVGTWPASLPSWLGKTDRVLVDAPCSGLGVLRRNPEARNRLTEDAVARLAQLQGSILDRFAPFVAPGGRLIYATCSILTQENDEVVSAFLERHPEFTLMPAKEIVGRERAERIGDGNVLRVDPRRHDGDGFFAVVLRRRPS
jgi:16S rRNA C967 or C1407 C5-methylase (RsmB/RsmF family)